MLKRIPQRREVLKNGGSNPDLIHHLLSDATVIEHISGDYARIIQSLKKLIGHVRGLQKGPWKLSGESLYESKKKLEVLQRHRDAWRELSEKAQSLIGLVCGWVDSTAMIVQSTNFV